MNIKHHNVHPVEWLRLQQRLTQSDFAQKLGLDGLGQYQRYLKSCHKKLLLNIIDEYGLDLSHDVISYLNGQIRVLRMQLKNLSPARKSGGRVVKTANLASDASSSMESILERLK